MSELRVALSGDEAQLGEVAAADVAYLILGVERALSRAASVIVGRPKTTTGRYERVIAESVHLKLRAVEAGSVVPVFEIPELVMSGDETPELEVASLGESALTELLAAADPQTQPHPVVAKALLELTDELHLGRRYEAVTFDSFEKGGRHRVVRVDAEVRRRLRRYVESVPPIPTRSDGLVGILVEADFERRSARLRTATEAGVSVSFEDDLADEIQAALREKAQFRGEVVYDPNTAVARSVRLRRIERGEQLVLGLDPEEFWRARHFDELAQLQDAGAPVDPDDLSDPAATDEERDAFAAAIAELE